jgi:Lipoprotein LpqB beta-propeller domain/Sporulation and spore germination
MSRPRPRVTGRTWRLLAGAAVAVALAGCAGIPTSGPVRQGATVGVQPDEPNARSLGQPPRPGSSQLQIVEGFVHASGSFDNDHSVARMFLTPDAAKTWNPSAGATIYDSSLATGSGSYKQSAGENEVLFTATRVGVISQQGEYADAAGNLIADFKLRKVDGEWRIATPPQGLLLTPADRDLAYRVFDVYFPDPARSVLVPNQVLLPVGPGASTSLVRALIAGPTPWLAPAVRTAIPTGTKLVVDSAPIVDGVVQVDLTSPAAAAIGKEAQAMSAQLVWTLRQLGGVTAVRITVQGIPLQVAGVPAVQDIASWQQWAPDGGTSNANAFYSDSGRLMSLDHDTATPVPGAIGDGSFSLHRPGVSFDETEVAGLDQAGHHLYVAKVGAGEKVPPAVVSGATRLTAPTWDRFGMVWTVDQRATGPVVWVDSLGSPARRVSTEDLPAGRVVTMRIARDGARVVVVVQAPGRTTGSVYLGRVERGPGRLVLSGFRLINTVFADTADVAWISADRLVVLGRTPGGALQPLIVDLYGASVQSLGPIVSSSVSGPAIVSITAEPGQEVLASTDNGKIYRYLAIGWDQLTGGQYPSYPG